MMDELYIYTHKLVPWLHHLSRNVMILHVYAEYSPITAQAGVLLMGNNSYLLSIAVLLCKYTQADWEASGKGIGLWKALEAELGRPAANIRNRWIRRESAGSSAAASSSGGGAAVVASGGGSGNSGATYCGGSGGGDCGAIFAAAIGTTTAIGSTNCAAVGTEVSETKAAALGAKTTSFSETTSCS